MRLDIGGREIRLYTRAGAEAGGPLLLLRGDRGAEQVWEAACRLTKKPFSLAALRVEDWENELSPWPAESPFRGGRAFGGGADETLRDLEDALPALREALGAPEAPCFPAGYSLAGLFAVYALYRSKAYAGAVSCSGSLWYPGFSEFAAARAPLRLPCRAELSLGDREARSRNPLLRQVESCTRELQRQLLLRGADCRFTPEPGGHFQDAELRLARGIARLLGEAPRQA